MRHRVSKRLFSWAAVTVAATVLAFGCSSTTDAGAGGISGTYTLSKINGAVLPAYIGADQDDSVFVTAGSVTLTSTTYLVGLTAQINVNGTPITQTQGDTGTYTLTGSSLTLHSNSDSSTISATVSGDNTLTVSNVRLGQSNGGDSGDATFTLTFIKQ